MRAPSTGVPVDAFDNSAAAPAAPPMHEVSGQPRDQRIGPRRFPEHAPVRQMQRGPNSRDWISGHSRGEGKPRRIAVTSADPLSLRASTGNAATPRARARRAAALSQRRDWRATPAASAGYFLRCHPTRICCVRWRQRRIFEPVQQLGRSSRVHQSPPAVQRSSTILGHQSLRKGSTADRRHGVGHVSRRSGSASPRQRARMMRCFQQTGPRSPPRTGRGGWGESGAAVIGHGQLS